MSPADTRRGTSASRGVTQLSLFDRDPTPAGESPDPPPNPEADMVKLLTDKLGARPLER